MNEDETKDGSNEVIEYLRKQPGIKEITLKKEHAESNPLYEIALDNIAVGIESAIKLLKASESIRTEIDIFSAYLILHKLHKNLIKG